MSEGKMPDVMVFIYSPVMKHSYWVDFYHRMRSFKTLEAHLRKQVKDGVYVGYRFSTINKEVKGVE